MSDDLFVGVDVGGTKIAVIVTRDADDVIGRSIRSSAVDEGAAIDAISGAVHDALGKAGVSAGQVRMVGVGVPGRVDPERGNVTLAVNLGWMDLGLGDALAHRLGIPCVIENDVRAAAVGLHERRVVGAVDDIAYLAVGTGLAAGVILDGRLHRGARGLAGEIGHLSVDADGPACACGQHGCLETFVSGPAITRRAEEAIAAGGTSSLSPAPGGISTHDVFAAARAGDALAAAIIEDVGRRLAGAVHLLVLTYDVERVVIGGGVSHAGQAFIDPIRRGLERIRGASDLAREMLAPDVLEVLPADSEAGVWGAVTIARLAVLDTVPSTSKGGVASA